MALYYHFDWRRFPNNNEPAYFESSDWSTFQTAVEPTEQKAIASTDITAFASTF